MTGYKIIGAALGVLGLSFGLLLTGYTVRGWKAEKDVAELTANIEAQSSAAYAAEAEANRKALEAREAEITRLTAESAVLAEKLKEVYADDPVAKNWADTALPDGIVSLLR